MPDLPLSPLDEWLDRLSKIAGILVPVVLAVVGGWYNVKKDQSDAYQQQWDNTQKQYSNVTALVPWLISKDPVAVSAGLAIFTSEAKYGQSPLDLFQTISSIANEQPKLAGAVQNALDAAKVQMASECKFNPDGIYIHVANNTEQLASGQQLATFLRDAGFIVQGVQRVDVAPNKNQLRYYFSDANSPAATKIIDQLEKHGFGKLETPNLSPSYLKQGCRPPRNIRIVDWDKYSSCGRRLRNKVSRDISSAIDDPLKPFVSLRYTLIDKLFSRIVNVPFSHYCG